MIPNIRVQIPLRDNEFCRCSLQCQYNATDYFFMISYLGAVFTFRSAIHQYKTIYGINITTDLTLA